MIDTTTDFGAILFVFLCLEGIAIFIAASRKLTRRKLWMTAGLGVVLSPLVALLYAIFAHRGEGEETEKEQQPLSNRVTLEKDTK